MTKNHTDFENTLREYRKIRYMSITCFIQTEKSYLFHANCRYQAFSPGTIQSNAFFLQNFVEMANFYKFFLSSLQKSLFDYCTKIKIHVVTMNKRLRTQRQQHRVTFIMYIVFYNEKIIHRRIWFKCITPLKHLLFNLKVQVRQHLFQSKSKRNY